MGKKRVEEKIPEMSNISIDDSFEEPPMQEVKKQVKATYSEPVKQAERNTTTEPINCLRKERIIVRFVPRPSAMVQNPKHILYGGMSENAVRGFVVPRLASTGMFKNVLTDSEKTFLEQAMGLEYNALSIYKKKDNFWDDSNPMGIGRVLLHKQDNYLDLSIPEDYIKYKILLANKDYIASSIQELEDRPKATYQFVLISEDGEAKINMSKTDALMECYMEFGRIRDDIDTLKVVVELLEGRPISTRVKLDFLQTKCMEFIQSKPRIFLSTVKDELLPMKVLIKKSLEAGLIGKRNNLYYLRSDNTPLCEINEESTLNNAAKYLSSPKRQDLMFLLQAKVKEE